MPTANTESGHIALQQVHENIENINDRVSARNSDIVFLKSLTESPILRSLVKVQDNLEDNESLQPVNINAISLVKSVKSLCLDSTDELCGELAEILDDPCLEAMIEAHDVIASKKYDSIPPPLYADLSSSFKSNKMNMQDIMMIVIKKTDDEPLGMTVRTEDGHLIIARILAGGIIHRLNLLNVGDTILEINGMEVRTHAELQRQVKKSEDSITFKIYPSNFNAISVAHTFVKALYAYDPSEDSLLPCKEIGLAFKLGDILEILSQNDPNWWQARRLNSLGHAGLIPSPELEERRHAFVRPEYDLARKTSMCGVMSTKQKKKTMYQSRASAEFDKAEISLYEEVARMPPFERKILILIGVQGVGRRSMKKRLIKENPSKYDTPLPHTSRPMRESEQDGGNYFFVTREAMEADIAENKYLEYGEHGGNLYGTKLDTVRAIIESGKICILDCNPQSLKILKTSEFMPYIVFIAPPALDQLKQMQDHKKHHNSSCKNLTFDRAMGRHGRLARTHESLATLHEDDDLKQIIEMSGRIQRAFEKYFDLILLNSNFEKTYEQLKESIEALSLEPQWVPISWVY